MNTLSPSTPQGSGSEPTPSADSTVKIEMVFRFWAPATSESREKLTQSAVVQHPGILALIEDVAAQKRGVLAATNDQVVVSGFKEPADALVVSRQIQHGMQGFRGKTGAAPVAVSIVIDLRSRASLAEKTEPNAATDRHELMRSTAERRRHSAEIPHELITLLAIAKPAQVLITHDLLQKIAAIKGLPLKSFPGRFGVYEYLWTTEDKLELLQSEPQLTLAALPSGAAAARGAKDQQETASATTAADDTRKAASEPERERRPAEKSNEASRRPLLLGGIAVAAVVVIAAIGIGLFRSHSSQPASATPAASAPAVSSGTGISTAPAQAGPASATAPAPVNNKAATASSPGRKNSRQKPAPEASIAPGTKPSPPPEPTQPCTLPGDFGKYASLAESDRERGDYENAVRIFRQVLNCDPNNAQARDGLSRALQALQQGR